jgi:hypothetical protein
MADDMANMADIKATEFDLDLRNEGARIVFDAEGQGPGGLKVGLYASYTPCGTPNTGLGAIKPIPTTHIIVQVGEKVVLDLDF